ncbi:VanZ family protein [Psychrosphaera haliotis]|uniref:VanZ-like domain-containing protein n=1 Tax=Psychrosphaera haliotis TaxID=555083 RepID=A0A6N8F6U2_9GAMM|nr:VanZ family protein [Psychrosphaera haliotis]MUH72295.1 hypothetical protein [Psychrosphaera haliotis]
MTKFRLTSQVLLAIFTTIATYYFLVPIDNIGPGIPHFDKFAHFIVFFSLSFFFMNGVSENVKTTLIVALVYGATIELLQGSLPYRSASLPDLIADMVGAIAYLLLHPKLLAFFKAK